MTKKREHDPELENLLQAFREVHPTGAEKDSWRAAIASELKDLGPPVAVAAPKPSAASRTNVYRFILRTAIQVGVAASLGFVVGAYIVERRYDQGQTMFFSQTEPPSSSARASTTIDEEREVVRINLDSGDSR